MKLLNYEQWVTSKGGLTLTPLGRKVNQLWLSGKYQGKMTNLMHSVDSAMKSKSYLGETFASSEQAKEATLLWIEGGYAKRFGSLKPEPTDEIDPQSGVNISLKSREQNLKQNWLNNFKQQSTNISHEEANKAAKEKGESTYKIGSKSFQVQ